MHVFVRPHSGIAWRMTSCATSLEQLRPMHNPASEAQNLFTKGFAASPL
jgi:hypothetical protein